MKKIVWIFIILNIFLLIIWLFLIQNYNFSTIDDFIYWNFFNTSVNKYKIKWEDKIILLKIDKKFFDKMWVTTSTFHRWYYTKLLEKLKSYWVKNITFDVYFWDLKYGTWKKDLQNYNLKNYNLKYDESKNNQLQNIYNDIYNESLKYFDNNFAKNIDKNVILWTIPYENIILMPSKKLLEKKPWIGNVESHVNKSGINDWVSYYISDENKKQNFLPLWYVAFLNKLYIDWNIKDIKDIKIEKIKSNNILKQDILYIKTSNEKYNFKIFLSKDSKQKNYIFTPLLKNLNGIKSYSIYDIITDEDNIYENIFKDKHIFIWATDDTLNDVKLSYLWMIPWVMFHINSFLSMYDNKYIYTAPSTISFIILFFIFLISNIFVVAFKDEKLSIITFFSLIWFLFISSYYLFIISWLLIPLWTIIVIFFIKLLIDILNILFVNQDKKDFITSLFKKYIWDKVLEKKYELKWKVAEKKQIAIMFSDIASFTNISERLNPQEVINMLNIYFEKINTPIIKSKWFIDKYIWDAIMAFWEDIENVDNIIYSIIQIQKIHPNIIQDIEEKLWKQIEIFTRIWLHYWEVVVWDVWDNKTKISYTAIWDSVNLASRLEWINKYYNTNIIISENFYKKIEKKEEYAIRLLDQITVKWKTKPIKIYQIMIYYKHEITYELISYIKEFEQMLEFYFKWDFNKAIWILEKLKILNLWKNDKVLILYEERLKTLIENSPENWDGIWKFTTK